MRAPYADAAPAHRLGARQWVRDDRNGFAPQYAQARSMQIDCWADEILTVAYREDLDPADKRVITENLRWLLSKLAPTRYGERLLLAGDPANPIQLLHKQAPVDVLSADALEALDVFCTSMLIESGQSQARLTGAASAGASQDL
jgi:hypothetical protein